MVFTDLSSHLRILIFLRVPCSFEARPTTLIMANQHESLRERTLNNNNLAGPEINRAAIGGDHADLSNRTQNNENLTAPTPDLSAPLEKDFSSSETAPNRHCFSLRR